MRRALFLGLAFGLAACTLTAPKPEEPSPVSVNAGGIEVTALDAPTQAGAAPLAPVAPVANPDSAAASLAGADIAASAAAAIRPEATTAAVPVTQATATTPHPKPRPAGLGQADAAAVPPPPPPKSDPQLLCEASGGIWGQSGGIGGFLCQKKTRDGGKVCHKKGDCSGECLGPSQTCSPVAPLMGCNDVMDTQGRMVTLCLD